MLVTLTVDGDICTDLLPVVQEFGRYDRNIICVREPDGSLAAQGLGSLVDETGIRPRLS